MILSLVLFLKLEKKGRWHIEGRKEGGRKERREKKRKKKEREGGRKEQGKKEKDGWEGGKEGKKEAKQGDKGKQCGSPYHYLFIHSANREPPEIQGVQK